MVLLCCLTPTPCPCPPPPQEHPCGVPGCRDASNTQAFIRDWGSLAQTGGGSFGPPLDKEQEGVRGRWKAREERGGGGGMR